MSTRKEKLLEIHRLLTVTRTKIVELPTEEMELYKAIIRPTVIVTDYLKDIETRERNYDLPFPEKEKV